MLLDSQMRKWRVSRARLTTSFSLGSVLSLLPTGLGIPSRLPLASCWLHGQTGRWQACKESRVPTGQDTDSGSEPPAPNRLCLSYPATGENRNAKKHTKGYRPRTKPFETDRFLPATEVSW